MEKDAIRKAVADFYDRVAHSDILTRRPVDDIHKAIGYTEDDLEGLPAEAAAGLGCGNPHTAAQPQPGETVVDLGCGKGMDAFIAAKKVGAEGRVIGVDMTPAMIETARKIAKKRKFDTVDFRLGEIEHLPIADNTADIVISNCVINLSVDKPQVYREILRVLKPGGRIGISDIVLAEPLPEKILQDPKMYGT